MPFADVVTKVKPAVVGMGILRDPRDPFSAIIIGTGFFVDRHGTILTNRHVAEHFIKERDGNIGVRRDIARAVVFVDATGRPIPGTETKAKAGYGAGVCAIVEVAMPPEAPDEDSHYDSPPDLAICRVDPECLARVGPIHHLDLVSSEGVREGDEVGICGFPLGLIVDQSARLRQMTPIVQRGIVAAVLPFSGIGNPHAFQLDIHINAGSSGSPVFQAETGAVIGVVFAAPERPGPVMVPGHVEGDEPIGTVYLPTGFGYAIPSNRYFEKPNPSRRLPDVYHRPDR
jgi:S1-C subfamily serine protease